MDNLNNKARLIDDWSWILYEDGSGHIENSEGKQFCSWANHNMISNRQIDCH